MILNGKDYKIPELSFNIMCELEDKGISIEDFTKKPMAMVRAFVAISLGGNNEKAGYEIEQHLIKGGKLEKIIEEIHKAVGESGFFRSIEANNSSGNATDEEQESTKD